MQMLKIGGPSLLGLGSLYAFWSGAQGSFYLILAVMLFWAAWRAKVGTW